MLFQLVLWYFRQDLHHQLATKITCTIFVSYEKQINNVDILSRHYFWVVEKFLPGLYVFRLWANNNWMRLINNSKRESKTLFIFLSITYRLFFHPMSRVNMYSNRQPIRAYWLGHHYRDRTLWKLVWKTNLRTCSMSFE